MLLRISLIIAILAGLAVGVVNFVQVRQKVVALGQDRDKERGLKETALGELAATNAVLKKTTAELNTTKANLEATTAERDQAVAKLAAETQLAQRLTQERDSARKDRDDAQAELERYHGTGLQPEQIIAMDKQYKALEAENRLIAKKAEDRAKIIDKLKNDLAIYKTPDYVVPLPAGLRGKVLITDPKWNFVVVNVGMDQGAKEQGELLVDRNGRLVAKVKIRSVQKDRSIANVMPGWQLGDVLEGDQVIPAHPEVIEGEQVVATKPGS